MSEANTERPEFGSQREQERALEQVLSIEREAQGIIADAEAEAQRAVADARRRASELEAHTRLQLDEEATEAITTALQYGDQMTRRIRMAAEEEMRAWEEQACQRLAEVVDWLTRAVTLCERDSDGAGD